MIPRVVLVGVMGYGASHLATLRELHEARQIELVGLVDRQFDEADAPGTAASSEFRTFGDLDAALDTVEPDSVVIATPPHTHRELSSRVLRRGLSLYLEKPPVPLLQDLGALADLARPDQRVEVGFQNTRRNVGVLHAVWSSGLVGEVYRITAHAAVARADSYYQRTPWAGKWFLDGAAVLDGPLFNPCAHILHAALMAACMVSPGWQPGKLSAECYSVRAIDGDDLTATHIEPREHGPIVVATATTAAKEVVDPAITLHGTRGEVTVRHRDGEARLLSDGNQSAIPAPANGPSALQRAVTEPHGEADPLLTLDAVRPYVLVVNAIVEAFREPHRLHTLGREFQRDGKNFRYLPGVAPAVRRVLSEGALFFDNREPWAVPPARIDLHQNARLILDPSTWSP